MKAQALEGIRVLDLSGANGQYCGKLFADLGADVLLVEPVAGSPVRRSGPFVDGRVHPEYSLPFTCFNGGKRGIAVDLDRTEGQRLLRELARDANLLIESERPGTMAERGLHHAALAAINPQLVTTSITPFGQTGPYAHYESEDIVALALGGLLTMAGFPDSAPVAAHGGQAGLAAAQFAAVASMMAVYAAEVDHIGEHIDVSVQECVVMAMENAVQFFDLEGTVRKRQGQQRQAGTGVFACSDGEVYLMAGGIASNRFWATTTQWLIDEGAVDATRLHAPRWNDPAYLATTEAKQIFSALFDPIAARHTKAYLYRSAQERRIPLCPINTPADIAASRQLLHRQFFVDVPHGASGRVLHVPGAPYRLSGTPWRVTRPSPRLGEHTNEVLTTLGYGLEAQAALLHAGVIA